MKNNKQGAVYIGGILAFIILILDTQSAVLGIQNGIHLCIESVIPALLPFCILSKYLMRLLLGKNIVLLNKIGKICGIPKGAESIFLIGFLGGYPTGAHCICDAVRNKALSESAAQRMLGLCNNVGPSFVFGILSGIFSSGKAAWALMIIQILSSIIVGAVLPYKKHGQCNLPVSQKPHVSAILEESVKTMSIVCAWVVMFKMVLQYVAKWLGGIFSPHVITILAGILELSNGCLSLYNIQNEGLAYILSAGFLSFGGLCVAMQTKSVACNISYRFYIPGKVLQCAISVLLAIISQPLMIQKENLFHTTFWLPLLCILSSSVILYVLHAQKKVVAFV